MSSSPCLKGRISSPLEAGPSVADGHHLPNNVNEALQYASKRLGRKAPHITLLVVRRDYQLPTSPIASPTFTPGALSLPVSAASTPSKPAFPITSRIDALKQLVRPSNSGEGQIRERIIHVHREQLRNDTASPAFSEASTASASTANSIFSSYRSRWPGSPVAYGSVPVTPATPYTVMSSMSGPEASSAVGAQTQFGMKLVYAHPLSPKEEKALSQALEKAAKKFKLDSSWLPEAVPPSRLGLPVDLVLKSSLQDEPLFSSQRLTLISLDHMYTFRTALQAYARTKASCRLEDAVDELRRLFLANGRRPLLKSALLAAYRWLDPISDAALAEVCRMYERAYGGVERQSGVENDVDPVAAWPLDKSNRDSGEARSLTPKRMGVAVPVKGGLGRSPVPPQRPEPPAEILLLGQWTDPLDKEILLSIADLETDIDTDDQSDLDAIEAWYRDAHSNAAAIEVDPLRSHPASTAVVEILPPPPSPPPPPPSSTPRAALKPEIWTQPDVDSELAEMHRTTPKLRPAPPGRPLALKLQTTFVKGSKRMSAAKQSDTAKSPIAQQAEPALEQPLKKQEEEEEEEEELTARPHSAIRSFATMRWNSNIMNSGLGTGVSIDEMLHGGGRGGESVWGQQMQQHLEARVGPMTPNGYDDISPITRGEWGLLMVQKSGRTVNVEMC